MIRPKEVASVYPGADGDEFFRISLRAIAIEIYVRPQA
jgi:hypothetical protein